MAKHAGKYVAYYRVSTQRQGATGYGLEDQRERVQSHLNGGDWELIAEFTEVESGKRSTDRHRHELRKALELCASEGATLVVAKLDRLTRNLPFLTRIIESGVQMIACDVPQMASPHQNRFVLQLMANIAELEGAVISERTRDALASAKKRGVVLGSPDPAAVAPLGGEAVTASADDYALRVGPVIEELEEYGCVTLEQIAKGLEARGVKPARATKPDGSPRIGKNGKPITKWSLSSVANVRRRYQELKL